MNGLRAVALVSLLLAVVAGGRTQGVPGDQAAIQTIYQQFFEALRNGGANGVLGYLRQSGVASPGLLDNLERVRRQLPAQALASRSDAYVMVNETRIPRSNRTRTFLFLSYHETQPVAWRLDFYRQINGVWIITGLQWEVDYVDDFTRMSALQFAAYRKLLELEVSKD